MSKERGTPYRHILDFFWSSKTKYSVHSPFVFDFVNDVMLQPMDEETLTKIESERQDFLNDKAMMDFVEYGAGSRVANGNQRQVSKVASSSLSGKWQCRLMHNMIKAYQPKSVLEIGTSLGISSAYLGSADAATKVVTLEGNPSSAEKAGKLFDRLSLDNISIERGEFGSTLQPALDKIGKVDCAFIDGNHRKQATIDYYNQIKHHTDQYSFLIIDDIYWSHGMHSAWKHIQSDPDVAFSIDLFRMGIVFFDKTIMPLQHFKLIESKWKLWSIGLFG